MQKNMLEFYEKKGRKIYIVIIIIVILLFTGMMFVQKYIAINHDVDEMKQLQDIAQKSLVVAEQNEYNGQVEYIEGEVEVRDNAASGWFSADKSRVIKNSNEVRTLNDSRAIITFEDGSSVRLDENTHIMFDNVDADIRVLMNNGSVYNKVIKDDSRAYIVQAGEYSITALGTEFSVQKGYDSVGVMVVESAVDIKNGEGEKIDEIQEGNKVVVQGDTAQKNEIDAKDLEEEFIAWNKNEDEQDNQNKKDDNKSDDSDEKKDDIVYTNGTVTLSGDESSSGVRLHWDVAGMQVPHGFKILKSKNKKPVYPGNDYQYLSNSDARDFKWKINTGKEYYFRVCIYDGDGGCVMYSNSVYLDTPNEKDDDKDDYEGTISLSADEDDGDVKLKWDISGGDAPKGFKIVKSKSKNPVYPGDDYKYISDSDTHKYTWKGFKKDKTYYFRVCIYEGGKCGTYSNNVKVKF